MPIGKVRSSIPDLLLFGFNFDRHRTPVYLGMKFIQIERQLLREKQTVATCLLCTNEGRLTAMSGHSQANKTR